jgi:hypothetical protein
MNEWLERIASLLLVELGCRTTRKKIISAARQYNHEERKACTPSNVGFIHDVDVVSRFARNK